MSVLVVGLSHRSAPVEVLERLAVAPGDVPKLLEEMLDGAHVDEAVLLSTCNRIEVCAVVDAFHGGLSHVTEVLGRHAGFELGELSEHLFVHYAGAAVQHLFSLAAGLDSMVVGESQILGQLRSAYAAADESGSVGKVLHELVQQALRVGKRVHAGTGIDAAGASVVSEALRDADRELGSGPAGGLDGARAVIVGAGAMGALAAAHLRRAGASEIVVLNRSGESGERLAEKVREQGGHSRSGPLSDLTDELAGADVLLACTGAIGAVVGVEPVAEAVATRPDRPLVVCDLGLPRDVDVAVAGVPGVSVFDLATLQKRLLDAEDEGSVAVARRMVAEEARQYLAGQRSAEVTPTVTALRRRAAEVVDAELLRLDSRLPDLDDHVREELSRTVRRVVDKLLHTPTVQVKRLAEGPDGEGYAAALRTLFELDPQAAAAVAAPVDMSARDMNGDLSAALDPATVTSVTTIGTAPVEQGGPMSVLRIGTRPSNLAMTQAGTVADRLRAAGHEAELVPVSTRGDRSMAPLTTLGTGVFVSALRDALAAGECDVAVHSYKDLPSAPDPRLTLAAVPEREDPRDALVAGGRVLGELPRGSRVGTGSPRRTAQLHALGLGLEVVPIRGNVETRIGKIGTEVDAVVVAAAGLRRLGLVGSADELLDPLQMLPAPAQGALAVECRGDDQELARTLHAVLDDPITHAAVIAERAVLATLEADCYLPIAAHADVVSDLDDDGRAIDRLSLRAVLGVGDVSEGALLRASATGEMDAAEKLGAALAHELLDMGAYDTGVEE